MSEYTADELRDEAERKANTMNLANALQETDEGGMPYGTYGNGF